MKFPLLSMVKPTELPLFEIPFMLVPLPAPVPGVGPVEVGELEAADVTLFRRVTLGTMLSPPAGAAVLHVQHVQSTCIFSM